MAHEPSRRRRQLPSASPRSTHLTRHPWRPELCGAGSTRRNLRAEGLDGAGALPDARARKVDGRAWFAGVAAPRFFAMDAMNLDTFRQKLRGPLIERHHPG